MTKSVNVQYVGFKADGIERKYSFIVRRALNEISEFTITIGNEAFGPRRVRFQDAPRDLFEALDISDSVFFALSPFIRCSYIESMFLSQITDSFGPGTIRFNRPVARTGHAVI
jgi:hypothetical protein